MTLKSFSPSPSSAALEYWASATFDIGSAAPVALAWPSASLRSFRRLFNEKAAWKSPAAIFGPLTWLRKFLWGSG